MISDLPILLSSLLHGLAFLLCAPETELQGPEDRQCILRHSVYAGPRLGQGKEGGSPDIRGLISSLGGQERGVKSWRGGRQRASVTESEKQREGKERCVHVTARGKGAEWKDEGRDVMTVAESCAAGPWAGGRRDGQCDQLSLLHPTQAQAWGPLVLRSFTHLFLGCPIHPSTLPRSPRWPG